MLAKQVEAEDISDTSRGPVIYILASREPQDDVPVELQHNGYAGETGDQHIRFLQGHAPLPGWAQETDHEEDRVADPKDSATKDRLCQRLRPYRQAPKYMDYNFLCMADHSMLDEQQIVLELVLATNETLMVLMGGFLAGPASLSRTTPTPPTLPALPAPHFHQPKSSTSWTMLAAVPESQIG